MRLNEFRQILSKLVGALDDPEITILCSQDNEIIDVMKLDVDKDANRIILIEEN